MSRWITQDIVGLLQSVQGVRSVDLHEQGGDVDTSNLVVKLKGTSEQIHVCGFVTGDKNIEHDEADDTDIEYIEVTDGQDSRGGLNSSKRSVCMAYADIVSLLRRNGHDVVPCLKDFF